MPENIDFTEKNIRTLNWNEHVRKRPAMYLGQVNSKGFIEALKGIINSTINNTESNGLTPNLKNNLEAKLIFNDIQNIVKDNWTQFKLDPANPLLMEMSVLNVLSKEFVISFWNSSNVKIGEDCFRKGILISQKDINKKDCSRIEVDFVLDSDIWGKEFKWNCNYITHQIKEIAYLYKNIKFVIEYREHSENCKIVYHFNQGLKDRLNIEILNGIGGCYLETKTDDVIEGFNIETAFAFREYSVDSTYLKSYANYHHTFENGTHVNGLLQVLKIGIEQYIKKYNLQENFQITQSRIKEILIALIHVKLEAPTFSGSVKNQLANPEITMPIIAYISNILIEKLERDQKLANKLIKEFRI